MAVYIFISHSIQMRHSFLVHEWKYTKNTNTSNLLQRCLYLFLWLLWSLIAFLSWTPFHFEGSGHGKKFLVTAFLIKRKNAMLFKSHKYSSQSLWVSFTMNEKADCSSEVRYTCALKLFIYFNLNHITGCQDIFDGYKWPNLKKGFLAYSDKLSCVVYLYGEW